MGNPPPLTVAASLVGVEGLTLLVVAMVALLSLDGDRVALGLATAVFLGAYGVVLLVAAWALTRRRGWARGPALITQLILLGLAWNLRDLAVVALILAVAAALAVVGVLHPASVDALSRSED